MDIRKLALFLSFLKDDKQEIVLNEHLETIKIEGYLPITHAVVRKNTFGIQNVVVNYTSDDNTLYIFVGSDGLIFLQSCLEYLIEYVIKNNLPQDEVLSIEEWGGTRLSATKIVKNSKIISMLRLNGVLGSED